MVRRHALVTVCSWLHKRSIPSPVLLDQLLPLLFEESRQRADLVHVVDMGPFKYQVDDGLETRKTVYECFYLLMENVPQVLDHTAIWELIKSALRDQPDLRQTGFLLLQRFSLLEEDHLRSSTTFLPPLPSSC